MNYEEMIEVFEKISTTFIKDKKERNKIKRELIEVNNISRSNLKNYYPNSIKAAESILKGTEFKNTQEVITKAEEIITRIEDEEKSEKKLFGEVILSILSMLSEEKKKEFLKKIKK